MERQVQKWVGAHKFLQQNLQNITNDKWPVHKAVLGQETWSKRYKLNSVIPPFTHILVVASYIVAAATLRLTDRREAEVHRYRWSFLPSVTS